MGYSITDSFNTYGFIFKKEKANGHFSVVSLHSHSGNFFLKIQYSLVDSGIFTSNLKVYFDSNFESKSLNNIITLFLIFNYFFNLKIIKSENLVIRSTLDN